MSYNSGGVPLRKLGKDGPFIPALGFGLMAMCDVYGKAPSDEERFAVLDRAVELGMTHWDGADAYGDTEALVGKWFRRTGKRDQVFLATKFGFVKGTGWGTIDSSAAYCKAACAESLATLGVDHIDLYYAHRLNPDTPVEETMRAMAELKAEGKIRHIGLSDISSATLQRACRVAPVAAVQMEYSPFVREIEGAEGTDLLATCRRLGVAVVAYAPLGRGLVTSTTPVAASTSGGGGDLRAGGGVVPWFAEENVRANHGEGGAVAGFARLARERWRCAPAQLALAWMLRQGGGGDGDGDGDVFPIPGTKRVAYLEQNRGALDVALTDDDVAEIRRFVEGASLAGGRIAEALRKRAYADTREE
ncbi:putative aldo/keto reductase [Xylariaceae sp. FL0804]|nr:putative aldo/keto reductase [Xylariaceae sp. FL0804]